MKNLKSAVILGAGPCGLGAAWRFKEMGFKNYKIFESSSQAGGLASSFLDDQGFTWDIGGHVQFSHYEKFDEVMDRALPHGWLEHQRESWVWVRDQFIPYPFQNNLWRLDKQDRELCIQGLEKIQNQKLSPKNFGEWIDASFGHGISEIFMRPYNFKVWAYAPETMSFSWIGERVATVDLAKVKANLAAEKDEISWGPNATFRFPKKGGTGAIWNSVAKLVGEEKINFNKRALKIDVQKKVIHFDDGTSEKFEVLLSTIPLDRLMHLCGLTMKSKLLSSNAHIVGIGLEGKPPEHLRSKCWMYFPEKNCPFYRVTVFSNYSPANVPNPNTTWSLMCETSSSKVKPVDALGIIDETVEGLRKTNLISSQDKIISKWYHLANPGYPTPTLDRDEIVDHAFAALCEHNIFSRGRFGAWKYEVSNQDHTFMQGYEWADWHLNRSEEQTVFFPSKVNAAGKRPWKM